MLSLLSTVILRGGRSPFDGNVHINSNGTIRPICDEAWNIQDANVICRSLGCESAVTYYTKSHFGQVTTSFITDNFYCLGNETRIQDCPYNTSTSNSCGENNGAGVECKVPGKLVLFNLHMYNLLSMIYIFLNYYS